MHNYDEDERPTVVGSNKANLGNADLRFGQSPSLGGGFESSGERPTMVKQGEPAISAVAWLYCNAGRRKGQLYQFRKERNEFGRAADCDIPIEDDFASAHHGAILLEGADWKIFDFASTNGTVVNDQKLGAEVENPRLLVDGDKIVIGDSSFIFKRI
jgi:hypothetical protein